MNSMTVEDLSALITDTIARPGAESMSRLVTYLRGFPPFTLGDRIWFHAHSESVRFEPTRAAVDAKRYAETTSANDASRWLIKVCTLQHLDIRLVAEITGVEVEGNDLYVGDLTITSPSGLPFVSEGALSRREWKPTDWNLTGLAYAYKTVSWSKLWTAQRPEFGEDAYEDHRLLADRLSIIPETSTMVTRTFAEIPDPDVARLFSQRSWGAPGQDAGSPFGPALVNKSHEHLLERLSAMRGAQTKVLDVALRRLNLARRRMSPGDSAIDTAIALEALLTEPSEKTEIAYRLRLRAALFLETGFVARRAIRTEVNELYALRSEVMHAGLPGKKDPYKIVALGQGIVHRIIEKIAAMDALPVWSDWEIAGGQPQIGTTSERDL